MSAADTPEAPPRPPVLRRAVWCILAFAALTFAAGFAYDVLLATDADALLDARVAALDADSPGWRYDDIDASRPTPPPGRNPAEAVRDARALLPRSWSNSFDTLLDETAPFNARLDEARRKRLDGELAAQAKALAVALTLVDMPDEGRFELDRTKMPVFQLLDEQQAVQPVSQLLFAESLRRADAGDVAAALAVAGGVYHAGRATGHEPYLVAKLIRNAAVARGHAAVFRALGTGVAPDSALAAVAAVITREETFPFYAEIVRGERAQQHATWGDVTAGRFPLSRSLYAQLGVGWNTTGLRLYLFGYRPAEFKRQHVIVLDFLTEMARVAALPTTEQLAAEDAAQAEYDRRNADYPLVRTLLPRMGKMGQAHRRRLALMRAARVLVAAERFRLAEKRWPDAVAALVPKYLDAVPEDPDDGAPLRYRRTADGVVAYGVGPDRTDDGGALVPVPGTPGPKDFGYRLFNEDERGRILPLPPLAANP